MTLDLTKPVQTRDGRKARIIATDRKSANPVVALVELVTERGECEMTCSYTLDGSYYTSGTVTKSDLVNVPEEKVWFYNVYEHRSPMYPYRTAADAKEAMVGYGGASLAVVFEDGKFKRVEVL